MSTTHLHKVGDIVFVDLEPVEGHEQGFSRPCIVVSVPTQQKGGTHSFGLLIVVPLTTKKKNWWTVVKIPQESGLTDLSYALCHQIRTISMNRVTHKIGTLRFLHVAKIRLVLATILGLN
jgi:mRNA interferase MazF